MLQTTRFLVSLVLFFSSFYVCAQEKRLMLPIGHAETVVGLDQSPNGLYLLSFAEDNTLMLWDKNTGQAIRKLHLQSGNIAAAKFIDNQTYGLLYDNGLFTKHNLTNGNKIYEFQHKNIINDFVVNGNELMFFYKKVFLGLAALMSGTKVNANEIVIAKVADGKVIKIIEGRYFILLDKASHRFITTNLKNEVVYYDDKTFNATKNITINAEIKELRYYGNFGIAQTDDALISFNENGAVKNIFKSQSGTPICFDADPLKNLAFVGDMKKLIVVNLVDGSKKQSMELQAIIEAIQFHSVSPLQVYLSLENGKVLCTNYEKPEGLVFKMHDPFSSPQFMSKGKELFSFNAGNKIVNWKLNPFRPYTEYTGKTVGVTHVAVDTLTGKIVSKSGSNKIWTRNAMDFKTIAHYEGKGVVLDVSPLYLDSICLLTYANNKTVIFNYKTNKAIDSVQIAIDSLPTNYTNAGANNNAILLNDDIIVQCIAEKGTVLFWNKDKKLMYNSFVPGVTAVIASPNESYILLKGTNASLYSFEDNGDLKPMFEEHIPMQKVVFGINENKILFTETNQYGRVKVLDIKKRSVTQVLVTPADILALSLANKKNLVAIATLDSIRIINLNSNKIEKRFANKLGIPNAISWKNDHILSLAGDDGRITFYDLSKNVPLYAYLTFNDEEQLVLTPNNYYAGDKKKTRLISFVDGLSVIPFEQYDIRFNRPDLVLKALGSKDTAMINSYKRAYEKRLRKLNIDTAQFKLGFNVPKADIKNRNQIEFSQQASELRLNFTAKDATYLLDRFNVWINECPIFGMKGVSLKEKKTKQLDTTIVINLADGDNKIEMSVINSNGAESYRLPLYVKHEPIKANTSKMHFIGIGINKFADANYNLNWSVKDIRDLANKFKAKYGDDCIIDTLFDEKVTLLNVKVLKNKLLQTSVNDKVIVAYSGHGLLSKQFDYYLSTYAVNFDRPEQNGLPYESLENLLDGIPARKKLMLIDACHSGEVDKDEMQHYEAVAKNLKNVKGPKVINLKKGKVGMKNSFELMQQLFVDINRSTGATVISAAAGTQFALETNELKNGVFTYSILNLMNIKTHATVSELKKEVNKQVPLLTQGLQVPTARSENEAVDWGVW